MGDKVGGEGGGREEGGEGQASGDFIARTRDKAICLLCPDSDGQPLARNLDRDQSAESGGFASSTVTQAAAAVVPAAGFATVSHP